MQAITVERLGGPEVLEWQRLAKPEPAAGHLLVRVAAAGVNFIDVYQRSGLYPMELPFIPGLEGAGEVIAAGDGVADFAPGDRVAWCDVGGSYAEVTAVSAARAVPVPTGLAIESAAAVLLQGITAHYLVTDTYPLRPGQRCLVHAAAGGVGLLLVQMAKQSGAEVYATAGGSEKCRLAAAAGADRVIDYQSEDFAAALRDVKLDVVYDGVGKATFERGLTLLRPRGMMVSYGNASGPPDPIAPLRLMQLGSLYLTRPTMFHYIATTSELRRRAAEVLGAVEAGRLQVHVGLRLPLPQAAEAHRRLEARETTGKVLLVP